MGIIYGLWLRVWGQVGNEGILYEEYIGILLPY